MRKKTNKQTNRIAGEKKKKKKKEMGKQKKKEKCPTEINVVYNLKVVNVMWNSNLKLKQNKKGENGKVKSLILHWREFWLTAMEERVKQS